jgi:hypothetical protein
MKKFLELFFNFGRKINFNFSEENVSKFDRRIFPEKIVCFDKTLQIKIRRIRFIIGIITGVDFIWHKWYSFY